MYKLVLVVTFATLPFLSAADRAAAPKQVAVHARAPRYSQEKLDRIRQVLTAQIAVREDAEGAMRAPTPQEAAAFALASDSPAETIALANGGVALRQDGSQMSLAVAGRTADGNVRITHGAEAGATGAITPTGGSNDR